MGARTNRAADRSAARQEGGIVGWHQSKSDPRKVYDAYHKTVCVCQTSDQAALIVRAVNALPGAADTFIRLREPAPVEKETGAEESQSGAASGQLGPLDTFEQDNCCGAHLAKAGRAGVLASVTAWSCPKCETEWVPTVNGPIRHWAPVAAVMIFK